MVCSRKQTNKGRAAEELGKTAAAAAQRRAADAVSDNDKEAADTAEIGCCSVCSLEQTNKGRAAEKLAKTAAAAAQRRAADAAFDDYNEAAVFASQMRLMVTWIKCMVVGHKWSMFKVRVCLLSCAEEVCFKIINVAQLKNQD